MWIVISLYSDNSTLDDVGVEGFATRNLAAEYLIATATEYIVDAENEKSTKTIEKEYLTTFNRLKAGGDLCVKYGATSWELRNIEHKGRQKTDQ